MKLNFQIVLIKILSSKCCVPSCNCNCDSTTEKVTVYKSFVDKNEKAAFIKANSSQNLVLTKYTVVYKKQWCYSKSFICLCKTLTCRAAVGFLKCS